MKLGGPLLNSSLNVDFIKSRAKKKLVIFGKARALNPLWKSELYERASQANNVIEF